MIQPILCLQNIQSVLLGANALLKARNSVKRQLNLPIAENCHGGVHICKKLYPREVLRLSMCLCALCLCYESQMQRHTLQPCFKSYEKYKNASFTGFCSERTAQQSSSAQVLYMPEIHGALTKGKIYYEQNSLPVTVKKLVSNQEIQGIRNGNFQLQSFQPECLHSKIPGRSHLRSKQLKTREN